MYFAARYSMSYSAWHATPHTLEDGVTRVMAGELPGPYAGFSMQNPSSEYNGSAGSNTYDVTMQVLLDARQLEGGGLPFPAAQRRARMVFMAWSYDGGESPSRADVAEILGLRAAWSSEHDAAAGGAAA